MLRLISFALLMGGFIFSSCVARRNGPSALLSEKRPISANKQQDVLNGTSYYAPGLGMLDNGCTAFVIKNRCVLTSDHCPVTEGLTRFHQSQHPTDDAPFTSTIVGRTLSLAEQKHIAENDDGHLYVDLRLLWMRPNKCVTNYYVDFAPGEPYCNGEKDPFPPFGQIATGSAPEVGTSTRIMGYGPIETDANGNEIQRGMSHFGSMMIDSKSRATPDGGGGALTLVPDTNPRNNSCGGDSGSPIYTFINGERVVHGVTSRGAGSCHDPEDGSPFFTFATDFENGNGAWIAKYAGAQGEFCRIHAYELKVSIAPTDQAGRVVATLSDPIAPTPPANPFINCGTAPVADNPAIGNASGTMCIQKDWAGKLTLRAYPNAGQTFVRWEDPAWNSGRCPCLDHSTNPVCEINSEDLDPVQEGKGFQCQAQFNATPPTPTPVLCDSLENEDPNNRYMFGELPNCPLTFDPFDSSLSCTLFTELKNCMQEQCKNLRCNGQDCVPEFTQHKVTCTGLPGCFEVGRWVCPTATPTPTTTGTVNPTPSSGTPEPTSTPTWNDTLTPSYTPTYPPDYIPTNTLTPYTTATNIPTSSPTDAPTYSPSNVPSATPSPTSSVATPTQTATWDFATPTTTPTFIPSVTMPPTMSASPMYPTATSSWTSQPTYIPSYATITTPTETGTGWATSTPTWSQTWTPTPTETISWSPSFTASYVPTATPIPSYVPSWP